MAAQKRVYFSILALSLVAGAPAELVLSREAAILQEVGAATPVASPCLFGRKYAQASKAGSATGSSAKIRYRSTSLCGEPNSTSVAASVAWTGVAKFVGNTPEKWAQLGYARDRLVGLPFAFVQRYTETKAGPLPADYEKFYDTAPLPGTHKYECWLLSSLLGTWNLEL